MAQELIAENKNNNSDYVRQDVFDAHMQRIDQKFDAVYQRFDSLEKRIDERFESMEKRTDERFNSMEKMMDERFKNIELRIDKNLAEFKSIVSDIKGEFGVINARLNGLETSVYWGFAILAFIVAFLAFVPPFATFFKNFRRPAPAITMEDVERAINAALKKANQVSA